VIGSPHCVHSLISINRHHRFRYNGLLSLYFLLTVRFGVNRRVFAQKYEKWLHVTTASFFLATAMAGIVMDMYSELEYVFGRFDCVAQFFGFIRLGEKRADCEHISLTNSPSFVCTPVELLKDVGSGRISIPGLCGYMEGCHLFSFMLVCRLAT
jgi:hypothetical protein